MACAKLSEVLWLGLVCVQSCNLSVACSFLNHLAFQKVGCLASHRGLEQLHLETTPSTSELLDSHCNHVHAAQLKQTALPSDDVLVCFPSSKGL